MDAYRELALVLASPPGTKIAYLTPSTKAAEAAMRSLRQAAQILDAPSAETLNEG
jgi:hypothetical protein